MKSSSGEGLGLVRLLMAIGALSPIFVVLAILGTPLIPDACFISFCAAMVVVPNAVFWYRIRIARRRGDKRELTVETVRHDHSEQVLVYFICLFAILLLFSADALATWRSLAAVLICLAVMALVFWQLNLYYVNVFLALLGYRFFVLRPAANGNPLSGKSNNVLITSRADLAPGERIFAYRVSDTVYFEART